MGTRCHVRSECDRCHAVFEADVTHSAGSGQADPRPMPTAVPPGWHLFMVTGLPHLWCPACMEGLQRFREANEAVEQSR